MAEILLNSQTPVSHQVFWNGDIGIPDGLPIAKLYDVTDDPAISPSVSPETILEVLDSYADENNPGIYSVNIPFQYTDRNRHLKLKWEYYMDSKYVTKSHDVFVVTPYIDFSQACGCLGISTDPSDPNYKSYRELVAAERYARKQIEDYTGQKFYLYDQVLAVYGYGSDILPLPEKINTVHELYQSDILLLDTINDIDNWNYTVEISETGYGIRINRSGSLDNTVYVANGMVPPSINDSSGIFQSNVRYRVQGKYGWNAVPDDVELAALELMKDYFSKDLIWKNKYIKTISTFDWDFEYTGNAYTGTGNSYADKLLAGYVLTTKVEVV